MIDLIKRQLGDNYRTGDDLLLQDFLEEATINALTISNRRDTLENQELLKSEIKNYVVGKYLQLGSEDVTSLGESGRNSSYKDLYLEMQKAIIKNGKRIVK